MKQPKQTKITRVRKFTTRFVSMAARAKAAGMSDEQVCYLCGVSSTTLTRWKNKYSEFKRACEEGRSVAIQYLISKGLQAAGGYDVEETTIEYTMVDGKEGVKSRKVKTKHVACDKTLLMFFLMNYDPAHFKDTREININEKHTLEVDAKESSKIQELCGELAKHVKIIDAEIVKPKELPVGPSGLSR